jgi:hypothetical protein
VLGPLPRGPRSSGFSASELMSAYRIDRAGLLKLDIEGGEFTVFGSGENLRWLDRADQVVMEVHGDLADAAAMVGWLCKHGFDLECATPRALVRRQQRLLSADRAGDPRRLTGCEQPL